MSKTNNDALIKELMAKVEEQKAALGTKKRNVLRTNGLFKRDNEHFNLNTVSNPLTLVAALGFLISQEEFFQQACSRLGVKGTFKWDGYSVAEWEADFVDRIAGIEYDKKKAALESTKTKLSALVSEEARTEMELENIKASLGV